jgi:DNA-binding CsgD family transcriptional regulator
MASRSGERPSSGSDQVLRAVEAIYEAALTPELWPDALARVSALCGSHLTIMAAIPTHPSAPGITLQNAERDPELLQLFTTRFTRPENNPCVPILAAAPAHRVLRREDHISNQQWERTEMYDAIFRPAQVYSSLGAKVFRSSRFLVPIGMMRLKTKAGFDTSELAALAALLPHLHNAVQTMLRLDALTVRAQTLTEAWDRVPQGLFLLDGACRLLWSNAPGERILSANNGLHLRNGRLIAQAPDVNRRLQQSIAACAATGGHGGALLVPRRPPARALSVSVSPVRLPRADTPFSETRSPAVIVFANDPDRTPASTSALLRELFGFTEREAALASLLLKGCELREAAEAMGVGITTVRTHLAQLFHKTSTNRQSELLRLLAVTISTSVERDAEDSV